MKFVIFCAILIATLQSISCGPANRQQKDNTETASKNLSGNGNTTGEAPERDTVDQVPNTDKTGFQGFSTISGPWINQFLTAPQGDKTGFPGISTIPGPLLNQLFPQKDDSLRELMFNKEIKELSIIAAELRESMTGTRGDILDLRATMMKFMELLKEKQTKDEEIKEKEKKETESKTEVLSNSLAVPKLIASFPNLPPSGFNSPPYAQGYDTPGPNTIPEEEGSGNNPYASGPNSYNTRGLNKPPASISKSPQTQAPGFYSQASGPSKPPASGFNLPSIEEEEGPGTKHEEHEIPITSQQEYEGKNTGQYPGHQTLGGLRSRYKPQGPNSRNKPQGPNSRNKPQGPDFTPF